MWHSKKWGGRERKSWGEEEGEIARGRIKLGGGGPPPRSRMS